MRRNDIVKDEIGTVVKDWIPDETSDEASKAIRKVGFCSLEHALVWQHDTFIERRHSSSIMHNKFIILVKNGIPVEVWTGSTNFTDGGIYGQSNVGHIVRDQSVAKRYLEYWNVLALDPPGKKRTCHESEANISGDEGPISFFSSHIRSNSFDKCGKGEEPVDEFIERQQPDLEGPISSASIHVIFSPRKSTKMLQWYADRMGEAKSSVHFTAAFGVSRPIAQVLNRGSFIGSADKLSWKEGLRRSPRIAKRSKDITVKESSSVLSKESTDSKDSLLRYILLDNKPSKQSSDKSRSSALKKGYDYVDYYDFKNIHENRIAYGASLTNDTKGNVSNGKEFANNDKATDDDWNTSECLTGLNTFVDFIHTKYMIIDALTDHPTVITGSANFSAASTNRNDENMLVIYGNTSVADVYFTEFMRLFDHFYSRDKRKESEFESNRSSTKSAQAWGEIVENESWLHPYFDPSAQLYQERLFLC